VLASPGVSATAKTSIRGLLVLADGVHAAFAAGAVAELARRGASWERGAGAGLGAHIAVLALLDEAAEAERRWLREAALDCPMFESRLGAARRRLGDARGLTLLPDPWSLAGWLDPAGLAEHLVPEMAAAPQRLARRGATVVVAVEDLTSGAPSKRWRPGGSFEPRPHSQPDGGRSRSSWAERRASSGAAWGWLSKARCHGPPTL
jgi:hypothetical protein